MKRALAHHLLSTKTKPGFCIEVMPFMNDGMQSHETQLKILQKKSVTHDFVYIASGDPHKNHRRLIDAWVLLAEEGFLPSLALTIDQVRFPDLFAWIEGQKRIYNLRIDNKGILTSSQVGSLYNSAGALIFPSLLESFGLPLIEAKNAGLPVLAGELDYVRDILHPAETFDPQSAVSISRAIKRFRYIEEPSLKIVDASVFIKCLHSD
jgi:glycosyltransferase involved in cell wall biosynthesis